jgi:peptidoglycan/LPS O-acetylase OafA/YrhL
MRNRPERKKGVKMGKGIAAVLLFLTLSGCAFQSGPEGSPALKLFAALGICLAAVFLIFYIVVKSREKE